MRTSFRLYLVAILLLLSLIPIYVRADSEKSGINWAPYSRSVFDDAQKSKKLILLNLEAVWCHWCHVMEAETYSNPEVQKEIVAHYLPIKVDQDSAPDLSARYRDYGWPATIILSAKGEDLVKLSGFVDPVEFTKTLKDTFANPTPRSEEEEKDGQPASKEDLLTKVLDRHRAARDLAKGGLSLSHRYIESDTLELSINRAVSGDEEERKFVGTTLGGNEKLVDPVWGGVFQYSTNGDWDHPHFEKIVPTQATNIRIYSFAAAALKEPRYLEIAKKIAEYLRTFLRSPDGAYYTSQDADLVRGQKGSAYFALEDLERRKLGIPRIDTNIYSRENGMIISSLAELYSYSNEQQYLDDAITAANWILRGRSLPSGCFSHDKNSPPFLGDSLWMLEAFLRLYSATGSREWLTNAQKAGDCIRTSFVTPDQSGYFSAAKSADTVLAPVRRQDDNILAVRAFSLLGHFSGQKEFTEAAQHALLWLKNPNVAFEYKTEGGIVMADKEFSKPPLHLTIIGAKNDPAAKALFQEAGRYPDRSKRVEWWDRAESPMPNSDVQYPVLPKAAAFVCTERRCSLPIFEPAGIARTVERFGGR